MSIANNFPYVNYHEKNLDTLQKYLLKAKEAAEESAQASKTSAAAATESAEAAERAATAAESAEAQLAVLTERAEAAAIRAETSRISAGNSAEEAAESATTAVTASQSAGNAAAQAAASATQAATSAAAAQMLSPIIYDFEASSGEIIPASGNTLDWSTFKNNVINGRAIVRLEITRPNGAEQTLIFRPNYLTADGTSTTPATTEESITAGVILSELQSTTIITILWTSAEELERGLYIIKFI